MKKKLSCLLLLKSLISININAANVIEIINNCLSESKSNANTLKKFGVQIKNNLELQLPGSNKTLDLGPNGDTDLIEYESFNELAKDRLFIKITRVNKGPYEHYYLTDSLNEYHRIAREDHNKNPYLYMQNFEDKDPATRKPVVDRLDFILVSPSQEVDTNTFALTENKDITNFLIEVVSNEKNSKQIEEAKAMLNRLII